MPAAPGNDFDEKIMGEIVSCSCYHVNELQLQIPVNSNVVPALLCKSTCEEEVECVFYYHCITSYTPGAMLKCFLCSISFVLSLSINKRHRKTFNFKVHSLFQIRVIGMSG